MKKINTKSIASFESKTVANMFAIKGGGDTPMKRRLRNARIRASYKEALQDAE